MHEHVSALSPVGVPVDLLAYLTLGLLGSAAHCVGMCGPLVLLVGRRYGAIEQGRSSPVVIGWYSLGRLSTYACLGAAAGGFGRLLQLAGEAAGLQRAAAVTAGLGLVAWALVGATSGAAGSRPGHGGWARLTYWLAGRAPRHPATAGLVLGLLPCGLLWTAVVAAMARGGTVKGAVALVAFGLGTVPALFGVALAQAFLARYRTPTYRLARGLVLVWGGWFLWRGLA